MKLATTQVKGSCIEALSHYSWLSSYQMNKAEILDGVVDMMV